RRPADRQRFNDKSQISQLMHRGCTDTVHTPTSTYTHSHIPWRPQFISPQFPRMRNLMAVCRGNTLPPPLTPETKEGTAADPLLCMACQVFNPNMAYLRSCSTQKHAKKGVPPSPSLSLFPPWLLCRF